MRPLRPVELAGTARGARARIRHPRHTAERAFARAGAGALQPHVELGSAAAVRSAVVAGTGPAIISELVVATDLADGRLVEVEVEGIDFSRSLRAVWPDGRRLVGPAAELLALTIRSVADDFLR